MRIRRGRHHRILERHARRMAPEEIEEDLSVVRAAAWQTMKSGCCSSSRSSVASSNASSTRRRSALRRPGFAPNTAPICGRSACRICTKPIGRTASGASTPCSDRRCAALAGTSRGSSTLEQRAAEPCGIVPTRQIEACCHPCLPTCPPVPTRRSPWRGPCATSPPPTARTPRNPTNPRCCSPWQTAPRRARAHPRIRHRPQLLGNRLRRARASDRKLGARATHRSCSNEHLRRSPAPPLSGSP
jgi:hypothetical protein